MFYLAFQPSKRGCIYLIVLNPIHWLAVKHFQITWGLYKCIYLNKIQPIIIWQKVSGACSLWVWFLPKIPWGLRQSDKSTMVRLSPSPNARSQCWSGRSSGVTVTQGEPEIWEWQGTRVDIFITNCTVKGQDKFRPQVLLYLSFSQFLLWFCARWLEVTFFNRISPFQGGRHESSDGVSLCQDPHVLPMYTPLLESPPFPSLQLMCLQCWLLHMFFLTSFIFQPLILHLCSDSNPWNTCILGWRNMLVPINHVLCWISFSVCGSAPLPGTCLQTFEIASFFAC